MRFTRGRTNLVAVTVLLLLMVPATLPAMEAAPTEEGSALLLSGGGRRFATFQEAIDAARDGDAIRLSAGHFEGPFLVLDKRLRVQGEGVGKTVLMSGNTVLRVAPGAGMHLSGVTIRSTGGDLPAPAVRAEGETFRLDHARVTGAVGYGLLLRRGPAGVEVFGSLIDGNQGGGVHLDGCPARLRGTVIAKSGGPGFLVSGTFPGESNASAEHCTIVGNVVADEPVVAAVAASAGDGVPESLRGRLSLLYDVLSGAVPPAVLARRSYEELGSSNQFVEPDELEDFFIDYAILDLRPVAPVMADPRGLEVGAGLSDEGRRNLSESIQTATREGRLGVALDLIRYVDDAERSAFLEQVRTGLYRLYVEHVETGRFGLALREFARVLPWAPESWRLEERLRQVVARVVPIHAVHVDWAKTLADAPELAAARKAVFAAGVSRGRPEPAAPSGVATWTVATEQTQKLVFKRRQEPIKDRPCVANPQQTAVADTLEMERQRQIRAEKQRDRLATKLEAAKGRMREGATYVNALERQLREAEQRITRTRELISSLEARLAATPGDLCVEVAGTATRDEIAGATKVVVTNADGSSSEATVDGTETEVWLDYRSDPAVAGGSGSGPVAAPRVRRRGAEERFVERVLAAAVQQIEARDVEELRRAAELARRMRAEPGDHETLYSLLAVYAPRVLDAARAQARHARLVEERRALPEDSAGWFRVELLEGAPTDPPVRLVPASHVRQHALDLDIARLESRWGAYWPLLDAIRMALRTDVGIQLEELAEHLAAVRPG